MLIILSAARLRGKGRGEGWHCVDIIAVIFVFLRSRLSTVIVNGFIIIYLLLFYLDIFGIYVNQQDYDVRTVVPGA